MNPPQVLRPGITVTLFAVISFCTACVQAITINKSNYTVYTLQNYPSAYRKNPSFISTFCIILFFNKCCCFWVKGNLVFKYKNKNSTKTKSVIHGCFHIYAVPFPLTHFNLSCLGRICEGYKGMPDCLRQEWKYQTFEN